MRLELFNLFIRMGLHGCAHFVIIHQAVHVHSAHLMVCGRDFNKVYFIRKEKIFGISIEKLSLNYFLKVYKRKKCISHQRGGILG